MIYQSGSGLPVALGGGAVSVDWCAWRSPPPRAASEGSSHPSQPQNRSQVSRRKYGNILSQSQPETTSQAPATLRIFTLPTIHSHIQTLTHTHTHTLRLKLTFTLRHTHTHSLTLMLTHSTKAVEKAKGNRLTAPVRGENDSLKIDLAQKM